MPYRTPARPTVSVEGILDSGEFWTTANEVDENRLVMGVDEDVRQGIQRLYGQWYKGVRAKYPKEHHVALIDLNEARFGRGEFVTKIGGKSKDLVTVFMEAARWDGDLTPIPEDFDSAALPRKELVAVVREVGVSIIGQEEGVRSVLNAAFTRAAPRIGKYTLERYPGVEPKDLMEALYFRTIAQRDFSLFALPVMARALYDYFWEPVSE